MTRILVWPADNGACGHLRLAWPAEAAAAAGVDVVIEGGDLPGVRGSDGRLQRLEVECDVLVVQRPLGAVMLEVIEAAHAQGIRVVVDMDDDLGRVDPSNVAYGSVHPGSSPQQNWLHARAACAAADLVTVTTPALLERYGRRAGVVIPNCLPESLLDRPRGSGLVAGWPGTVITHPHDLQVTRGAVARAVAAVPGASFLQVGPGDGLDLLGFGDEADQTGSLDLVGYLAALRRLDVTIVPLADTAFNRAKCLDARTRIATRRGIIPLHEVAAGDLVWSDGRWVDVEAVSAEVPTLGVLLTTKSGRQLRLTDDHRLHINGRWTRADATRLGDLVALARDDFGDVPEQTAPWPAESRMSRRDDATPWAFVTAAESPRVTLTPAWGRMLGLYMGDGTARRSGISWSMDGQDADLIDALGDDVRSIGLHPSTERTKTYGGELLRRRTVGAASAHLRRFIQALGGADDRRKIVCVPEAIWLSPKPIAAAFLAGLFEADGTCGQKQLVPVQLSTIHLPFARDVQRLLAAFGIEADVRKGRSRSSPDAAWRTSYKVATRRAGSDLFAEEIGFLSERKRANLARLTATPHSNAYKPQRWTDEVVSVERCWLEPVDLQVAGSVFAAAGFLSHNSSLKVLEAAFTGSVPVMSPTPDNLRLHAEGVGLVAQRPRDWHRALVTLLGSEALRHELAGRAREVAGRWTIEANVGRWVEAWTSA